MKCKTCKDLKQHIFLRDVESSNFFFYYQKKKNDHVFGFIEEGCYMYDKTTS